MAQDVLMAHRTTAGTTEAEPVIVDTDQPDVVVLRLDDGQELELDAHELRGAIDRQAA